MGKIFKRLAIVFGVILLLFAAWFTDNFIYPFKAESPNFSDVEKAFSKLQFPADWQEISSSENRGLHGRGCSPLNDSGCFTKSLTYKITEKQDVEQLKKILLDAGCEGVSVDDISSSDQKSKVYALDCGIGGGVNYGIDYFETESEANVSAKTY